MNRPSCDREVEAVARLNHANIVTAYEADGVHFLVMEYVAGQDLSSLLRLQGPLSVQEALDCVIQTARGLEYAHQQGGIVREIVFILDFYHASEHLLEFAKVLHRDDEARQQQTDTWCHKLKHEGGQSLLRELEAREMTRASADALEAHRQLLGYLRNNQHRMDYPTYLSRGWQIGSGMVEAACKTVVGQRLKESGMRWREHGTTALSQLRALYKSEPKLWKNYWNRTLCS